MVESMAKTNEQGLCSERCKAAKSMMLLSEPNLDKVFEHEDLFTVAYQWVYTLSGIFLQREDFVDTFRFGKNVFENKIMIVLLH